ncbi:hypothetical protein MKW98_018914, partial [Papaver atlanticum]
IASAWKSNCIPGDIYIDSTALAPIPFGSTFKYCTDWCDEQSGPVSHGCRLDKEIRCRCCCGSSPPSPSSPPSGPLPPPFEGRWPQTYEICPDGEEYLNFNHKNGTECIQAPKCEQECKDIGLLMARKECVAGGESYPRPRPRYKWYEQCYCQNPPPPPHPQPPPPPPPRA